jgi:hypothetical protein
VSLRAEPGQDCRGVRTGACTQLDHQPRLLERGHVEHLGDRSV